MTGDLARLRVTDIDAGAGEGAFLSVGDDLLTIPAQGALRAGGDAGLAVQAALLPKHAFRPAMLALRVVAPLAPQRAALEKHGGAQTWPVVDREPADIENGSAHGVRGGCAQNTFNRLTT